MSRQEFRLPIGGLIDRSRMISFNFDGLSLDGYEGDSVASALLANGIHLSGRSFKYHRPRGIYTAGVEEMNALISLYSGNRHEPNVRATITPLCDGLEVKSQNRWPSLKYDVMEVNQLAGGALAAGFYYKTFMGPTRKAWRIYEYFIRWAAGLGKPPSQNDPDRYEKSYAAYDVMVVGSGPSGLAAARAAGASGARVLVVEQDAFLGSTLAMAGEQSNEANWRQSVLDELDGLDNVDIFQRTTVFGAYDHGTWGLVELVDDYQSSLRTGEARQRLWTIHAKQTIVAAGAIERPFVFSNNDRPGILLASAARTYVQRYGVLPGKRAIVAANNDSGIAVALDLIAAGIEVSLVDTRNEIDPSHRLNLEAKGAKIFTNSVIENARGRLRVTGVDICEIDATRDRACGSPQTLACDFVCLAGGWSPTLHLLSQRGAKPVFDGSISGFVPPSNAIDGLTAVGSALGLMDTANCIRSGHDTGTKVAKTLGFKTSARRSQLKVSDPFGMPWHTPVDSISALKRPDGKIPGKAFVDLQNDVTWEDVELAQREGYTSPEHLKRYTTLGMATDQGKTANTLALALMATHQNQPISAIGTTTFRPPYTPVSIGVLAADATGRHYKPTRRTPMHQQHLALGAPMTEVGLWMRPWYYPRSHEGLDETYVREMAHVRSKVGITDISTLGKIAVQGPDAAEFLNRVYTNGFLKLGIGRQRYGLMLRDDGMVWDDGVTARLGDTDYFMTTTTSNAGPILDWLEFLLQTAWTDLKVHVTSITDQWAAVALSGPRSRTVLENALNDGDVSNTGLAHMAHTYGTLSNIDVRIHRMSYSGELSFEVYAAAGYGRALWTVLLEAGADHEIVPYGLESLAALRIEKGHVAGQELNGRTTLRDLRLEAFASKTKPFVGQVLADREYLTYAGRPRLVGLEAMDPRAKLLGGMALFSEDVPAKGESEGEVLSVTYSPIRGRHIALALLSLGHEREGETIKAVSPLDGLNIAVKVVSPHFYDPKGERMHG